MDALRFLLRQLPAKQGSDELLQARTERDDRAVYLANAEPRGDDKRRKVGREAPPY